MKRSLAACTFAACLLVTACGDDTITDPLAEPATEPTSETTSEPTSEPTSDTATETATDAAASEPAGEPASATASDTADVPSAIVSLSPTATEMLYAIGAGDQVLAVDDFSNYPPETADKMQGINAYEPNAESIASLEPDLVITDGTNPDFLAQLDSLGIAHWEGPAAVTFDDVYTQIEQLGAVTGHVGEAAELVGEMQTDIAAVVDALPELDEPLTYYHELDESYFSVGTDTFIGAVYAEIGLQNITEGIEPDPGAYPQLSAEFIIESNPDLIFLACTKYCGETSESVAARPGWDTVAAVQHGGVIEMDDDMASRWGPRIVDYLEIAGAAVTDAATVPAG